MATRTDALLCKFRDGYLGAKFRSGTRSEYVVADLKHE